MFFATRMYFWLFFCVIGMFSVVPVHFISVEHTKLQKKYGKERGIRVGDVLSMISGWGLFPLLVWNLDHSTTQIYYSSFSK